MEKNMSTKELLTKYNFLATRAGVKKLKAWKDSKAKLQARIDALVPAPPNPNDWEPTPDPKPEPKKKAPAKVTNGVMTVADLARELGINPKVARAKLRRNDIKATEGRYVKFDRNGDLHKSLVAVLVTKKAQA